MTGILLCVNQIPSTWPATLSSGFTVSNNKGVADDYNSVAGTILHEMVHALDTNKCKSGLSRLSQHVAIPKRS